MVFESRTLAVPRRGRCGRVRGRARGFAPLGIGPSHLSATGGGHGGRCVRGMEQLKVGKMFRIGCRNVLVNVNAQDTCTPPVEGYKVHESATGLSCSTPAPQFPVPFTVGGCRIFISVGVEAWHARWLLTAGNLIAPRASELMHRMHAHAEWSGLRTAGPLCIFR